MGQVVMLHECRMPSLFQEKQLEREKRLRMEQEVLSMMQVQQENVLEREHILKEQRYRQETQEMEREEKRVPPQVSRVTINCYIVFSTPIGVYGVNLFILAII